MELSWFVFFLSSMARGLPEFSIHLLTVLEKFKNEIREANTFLKEKRNRKKIAEILKLVNTRATQFISYNTHYFYHIYFPSSNQTVQSLPRRKDSVH